MPAGGTNWQDCCIVGSGSSLRGFDPNSLRSRTVIAVNDAMAYMPWAQAIFSQDHNWVRANMFEIIRFAGQKFFALAPHHVDLRGIPRATYLRRAKQPGLSTEPGVVHIGGCSGYGALNLAVLLGAKRVTLFGFDLTPGRFFSGGAPEATGMYGEWAEMFDSTLPDLERLGVEVLNASQNSAIKAFPKIDLEVS